MGWTLREQLQRTRRSAHGRGQDPSAAATVIGGGGEMATERVQVHLTVDCGRLPPRFAGIALLRRPDRYRRRPRACFCPYRPGEYGGACPFASAFSCSP